MEGQLANPLLVFFLIWVNVLESKLNYGILCMLWALLYQKCCNFRCNIESSLAMYMLYDTLYHRSILKLFLDDRPQQVADGFLID